MRPQSVRKEDRRKCRERGMGTQVQQDVQEGRAENALWNDTEVSV